MRKFIVIATLAVVLLAVNWSIYTKEQLLKHGEVVVLRLAPVDPRSLMQGDYMALEFVVAQQIGERVRADEEMTTGGYVYVSRDESLVGSFSHISPRLVPNQPLAMKFRVRDGQVKLATNAYFFEEGKAQVLESAHYGEFRVADDGEMMLVGLLDEHLSRLD